MAKFVIGKKVEPTRVFGGGEYAEEWFDVVFALPFKQALPAMTQLSEASTTAKRIELISELLVLMIKDWSITDEQGNKAEINTQNFDELTLDLVAPLFEAFNASGFLVKR